MESERFREQEKIRRERYGEIDDQEEKERKAREEVKVEFECVLCSKVFKSEKQFENHEQSKAHKLAVKQEQLRRQAEDDEDEDEDESQVDSDAESGQSDEPQWKCDACDIAFDTEDALFDHIE